MVTPHLAPSTRHEPMHATRTVLRVLEILLIVGAVGGAVGLITGGLDLGDQAQDLPFHSPVLGGVALLLTNALVPAIALRLEHVRSRHAPTAHFVVGFVLVGWIVVQVAFIGLTSPLQFFYFAYGLVVATLAWTLTREG